MSEEVPGAQAAADAAGPDVDYSAIDTVAGHDPRLARSLRASIAVIARRTDDPSLRRLCIEVLHGTQSVRRVFAHPAFNGMVETSLDNLEKGLDRLDPQTREDLIAGIGVEDLPEASEFAMMEGRPLPGQEQA